MILYLTEPGLNLAQKGGHFVIRLADKSISKEVPVRLVHSIVVYSYCGITSGALTEALRLHIPLIYLSPNGRLLGKLVSEEFMNGPRQKKQILLTTDSEICLRLSVRTIGAKIHNEVVFARRLARANTDKDLTSNIHELEKLEERVHKARSINELSGLEGIAARRYFDLLSATLPEVFRFSKRTKHPAQDPANAMLNFAYTLLYSEVVAILEAEGLNPYFGFMHQLRKNHCALASDLMEEYRSVLADPLVVNFLKHSNVRPEDFEGSETEGGRHLRPELIREFLLEYEKRMQQKNHYTGTNASFREVIAAQAHLLAKCVDVERLDDYLPLRVR